MRSSRLRSMCALGALAMVCVLLSAKADAGEARRPYRVGVLNEASAANHPTVEGLKAGLEERGLEEGRDVTKGNPSATNAAEAMRRREPGEFSAELVDLLETFAAQSALAIENARLFREMENKGRQLEAASRHKSEFLANISHEHELRRPLNAVIGFSEVLAERMFAAVNEKQAEYLQDILSSGRHLLSLINDILDPSKVEAGRLELEFGRFHIPTALDDALNLVRERATGTGSRSPRPWMRGWATSSRTSGRSSRSC